MLRETVINTDDVVRFSKDINETNQIKTFNRRYGISLGDISAIFWEKPITLNSGAQYRYTFARPCFLPVNGLAVSIK